MVQLGFTRYGKAEVRVVRIIRGAAPDGGDVIIDRNVSSAVSGDIGDAYYTGDNTNVLATDTQKNLVNVFAKRLGNVEPEEFATKLAQFLVTENEPLTRARVAIDQYGWTRIGTHTHSFARAGDYVRTTTVVHDQDAGTSVVSGLKDLIVLNTTNSEFWGFPRDAYTTLPETKDRILATQVEAQWRFRPGADLDWAGFDWGEAFETAKQVLLDTFAGTYSYALQQTLYAIGTKIIETVPAICEVRMALPNKHHFLVDLELFGETNDNEVFYAADRPYGLIEGIALADDAPDAGLAWT